MPRRSRLLRSCVEFAVIAAIACFFVGPIGILYAVGFTIFYAVMLGIAAILDPKTFVEKAPPNSN